MSEELQGLLNKIQQDGIQKAEQEKNKIISRAQDEAKNIIKTANESAFAIIKKAQDEAKNNEIRAKASIQQAARDIVIALQDELQDRLQSSLKGQITNTMTPELLSEIIKKMVEYFTKKSDNNIELNLIFAPKDINKMIDLLKNSLKDNLKKQPAILKGQDFAAGLKIGFKGSDVFIDFSDNALTDIICEYIGPRLSTVLKEEKE